MERLYSDGGSSDSSSYAEYRYNSTSSSVVLDSGATAANSGRNGGVKYCGVCGDIAKSYHFGGLSCDSCKAFFRRSVQNDNYLHFQCCHRGQCVISLSNRKSCQYCRMKRCFAIGMEKSWVMTEDERKALMKARAEKKTSKRSPTTSSSSSNVSSQNLNSSSNSSGGEQSPSVAPSNEYEPQVERMIDFMAPLEIKEIESIVTKYMHAYQHVPYRSELRFFDNDRPGVQVMEMFGTLIRRFAFYARLMADFSSLPFHDQSILLKGGVLEMCLLRGALVFDPETNRWPTANMSMYKDMPILKLDNIVHLTSSRLFQMHLDFISCIRQMSVDEPTIMLLILIVLFTPERTGLVHTDWIEKFQSYYTTLLEHYLNWRFGTTKAKFIFGKMLTKLSDLRELSDTHNHHNLRLGNDEVSSIQNQLNTLKLNPYPELKVIHDGNEASAPVENTYHPPYSNSPTLNAKEISNCLSDVELAGTSSAESSSYQQAPVLPVSTHSSYTERQLEQQAYQQQGCQTGQTHGYNAQQLQTQFLAQQQMAPPQQPPTSQAYQQPPTSQGYQQQPTSQGYQQPPTSQGYQQPPTSQGYQQPPTSQRYQQAPMNMALQFMQAMQQSVSQVVNAPHFGYEWVKPDYQFDPATAFAEIGPSKIDPVLKAATLMNSSQSPPLTERDIDDLYDAIDELTGKDVVEERILQTTNSQHLYHQ
ncbi:hypothetical protein OUZ56_000521 [Daphnia magna]|uniref:Retinoid x receptor n=1 Tax=Daphnia magna TaxID=35525 RepID=A0ABR0A018_9CRUS|nr:hypothetical protein OUZ56_000521 [Daphnia magna]